MAHSGLVLLALLVLGCSHAEPFAVSDPVQDGPLAPGAVIRLTYSAGVSPASWLPVGDTLVLAERDQDRDEGDVCLFLLPAGGGTRQGGYCSAGYLQADSIESFGSPAVSSDRTVAATYRHQRLGGSAFGAIRAGPLATPFIATDVASLPFSLNGRIFQNATDLAWQPDGSLVFLAWTDEAYQPCETCDGDLYRIPYGIVRVDPGTPGLSAPVVGGYLATSVTPDGMGGLFTTYAGSDQLWRISAGGDSVAVHDFGPGSKVRGADHRAGKVAIILGGTELRVTDDIGVVQVEDGVGALAILDLASGSTAVVSPPDMLFRDPALSPDGRSVVARGSHFTTAIDGFGNVDTVLTRPGGDLWRINVP
jgi:hypothetical protein